MEDDTRSDSNVCQGTLAFMASYIAPQFHFLEDKEIIMRNIPQTYTQHAINIYNKGMFKRPLDVKCKCLN